VTKLFCRVASRRRRRCVHEIATTADGFERTTQPSAASLQFWVTTADGCVHTDDTTKLSPTSCEFVYTPPTRRDSTASSRRRRRCVLGIAQYRLGDLSITSLWRPNHYTTEPLNLRIWAAALLPNKEVTIHQLLLRKWEMISAIISTVLAVQSTSKKHYTTHTFCLVYCSTSDDVFDVLFTFALVSYRRNKWGCIW